MPDLTDFFYGCPFCENGAASPVEFALHLEDHFLDGADRWLRTVLPRVVEAPPAEVPVSA